MTLTPLELSRARSLAPRLAAKRSPLELDIQRVFAVLPPESPLGEALFRLVEAFPRTPERANRRALVDEFLHHAVPLLPVGFGTDLVGGQFVYAETIDKALERAAQSGRNVFSFDMLGEGARTAGDAERNFGRYRKAIESALRDPQRFGVSIKLSSIHPRYDAQGYGKSKALILERLTALCGIAAAGGVQLTIDAEESERLPLQLDLFEELRRCFPNWNGLGLAVQAYQRGIHRTLDRLLALEGRFCVRLVKGAYWDAEVKRAQELGVADYPVFTDKRDTDLAYVQAAARLLDGTDRVFPQFATHNPVTAACILALAESRPGRFEFQRLHGMGRSLDAAHDRPVRIYAPVGERKELLAYLVRRLLENGASTSFVRKAARAEDLDALLDEGFDFLQPRDGHALPAPTELLMPERRQARGYDLGNPVELAAVAQSVGRHRGQWEATSLLGGRRADGEAVQVHSPARPELAIGTVVVASTRTAGLAVECAFKAKTAWAQTPVEERARILERAADLMEADTEELMALCVWEAGKTLPDALADVREAVDFCRYYAVQARKQFAPVALKSPTGETNVLTLHGRGVFACISPWNFPLAIFTGQVVAALVAGNTVVAKPAEQTPLSAFHVAQLLMAAGVPGDVLQLVIGDGEIGRAIVEDPRIAGVVFTGSNEVARSIQLALAQRQGPLVPLIAETGGLNAMIVDSTALPEQVVDAVVSSAFRSAGQRCSSLRMLYLQDEIAPAVIELLRGAMRELRVGDPADPATDIGPVIDADARRALLHYTEQLKKSKPVLSETPVPESGHFVSPLAVEVGSIRDLPGERFGPILHVARFAIEELDRVIDDINATGYGLTMGVHTRIDSRAEHIRRRAAVGNLYVNRNMIGAVVGVQPFGGEGLSGTGPKAGGPRYLARFATERVFTVNTAAAGGDLELLSRAA